MCCPAAATFCPEADVLVDDVMKLADKAACGDASTHQATPLLHLGRSEEGLTTQPVSSAVHTIHSLLNGFCLVLSSVCLHMQAQRYSNAAIC